MWSPTDRVTVKEGYGVWSPTDRVTVKVGYTVGGIDKLKKHSGFASSWMSLIRSAAPHGPNETVTDLEVTRSMVARTR